MELRGKAAALYGRFTPGAREKLAADIERRGGRVARDLMRRTDLLVVGALAIPLIDDGRLSARLDAARARKLPIIAERRLARLLRDETPEPATLPLLQLIAQTGIVREDIDVLAAFDIVRIDAECCRFGDVAIVRNVAELIGAGRSLSETVRILVTARDRAPKGRRKIVVDPHGKGALEWESGLTTLEGQGYLPLESSAASVEDLFEAAAAAEAEGDCDEAARLYDMSARADKKDPVAPYNLGNIKLSRDDFAAAVLAYRLALSRDGAFVEARYNLAQSLERLGKLDDAREELTRALDTDPAFADARFNLAQLELKRGEIAAAKTQFERYLAAGPPDEWAAKARKAIQYCTARLSA